jgi:hypothetical protein
MAEGHPVSFNGGDGVFDTLILLLRRAHDTGQIEPESLLLIVIDLRPLQTA